MSNVWAPIYQSPCLWTLRRQRPEAAVASIFRAIAPPAYRQRKPQHTCLRVRFASSSHAPAAVRGDERWPRAKRIIALVSQCHRSLDPEPSAAPVGRPHRKAGFLSFLRFVRSQMAQTGGSGANDDGSGGDGSYFVDGPPFRAKEFSQAEVTAIFGPGVPAEYGNRLLRFQQNRRVTGTLENDDDERGSAADDLTKKMGRTALAWLRANYPVNEVAARRAYLRRQEAAYQREVIADAERIGIYKPQSGARKGDVYGRGALDEIRDYYAQVAKEREARMEAEDARLVEERQASRELVKRQTELKRAENAKWVEYYRDRAMLIKDSQIPNLTRTQRLVPSAIFALVVVVLCAIYAENYTAPSHGKRLWPEIPPAGATILGIILLNAGVMLAWRIPPAWRMLNKYFIAVPGYPFAASMLGQVFSHQQFGHFFLNMIMLWWFGTRLHDQIGRGNFLAIYISSGVLGALTSLTALVFSANLVTASLGASGAVSGVMGAWCILNSHKEFSIVFIPDGYLPPLNSLTLLGVLVVLEFLGLVGRWRSIDHWAHIGGYFSGISGAYLLKRRRSRGGGGGGGQLHRPTFLSRRFLENVKLR